MEVQEQGEGWSDRKYDFSYSAIEEKLSRAAYYKPKELSLGDTAQRCVTAILSSIFGHQFLYLLQGNRPPQNQSLPLQLSHIWGRTFRGTQYTIILFTSKVISDYIFSLRGSRQTEYQRGGMVGLVTYLINRPLDQLETARRMILLNEKRDISRLEALRVVVKHDGLGGLYKGENILGPGSAILHRSVYFGLMHRLSEGSSVPQWTKMSIFSLAASTAASATSFLTDKLRSVYLFVHEQRNTAISRRGRAAEIQQSVTKQVMGMFIRGEITVTKNDIKTSGVSILRNWILLAGFECGDRYGVPFVLGNKVKDQ